LEVPAGGGGRRAEDVELDTRGATEPADMVLVAVGFGSPQAVVDVEREEPVGSADRREEVEQADRVATTRDEDDD
jgi:hypothetical protein